MPASRRLVTGLALALTSLVAVALTATAPGATSATIAKGSPSPISVLKVSTTTPNASANKLAKAGFDLVEARVGTDLLVMGDAATLTSLKALGYDASVYQTLASIDAASGDTFYGGYNTAAEYLQHLDDVAAANPSLAVTYDVGDSWRKTQGLGGSDLKVVCLTAQQPGDCQLSTTSTKPRFVVISAVHARELSPTEVAQRWIDDLIASYNVNAELTALLDSTEIWVMPLANPDGREIAEGGSPSPYLQRKNANNTLGSCANPPTASNQAGVDINRNFDFLWGGVGTSTDPCAQTYRGTSGGSEPETAAIQNLLSTLYPDSRGPNITDAAPSATPGYMLTMHSYANMMLFPWGHINSGSPNDAGLRSAAFRITYYNGYRTGQPGQILYNVSGSTDDWVYGRLGVAGGTIEIGPQSGSCSGFVPAYSCQTTFYSLNKPALTYAAKLARAPYQLALGPNTRSQTVSSASVVAGASVTLSATGDDNAYGNSGVSRPSTQTVNSARYFLDTPPWAGGTAVAMTATDGSFNNRTEGIRATVNTTGWSLGRHTLYVQARDSSGNWGPVSAVFLTVT